MGDVSEILKTEVGRSKKGNEKQKNPEKNQNNSKNSVKESSKNLGGRIKNRPNEF